jgi:glycosyltransferase involved in cell wall biosynthesis
VVATSLIIPCRNKAQYVGECLQSALNQTVDDFEVVISDQGSEDESCDAINRVIDGYKGNKAVRFLHCPDTEYRGMRGLNAHLNWLHGKITGDLVINCSADDRVQSGRVERTRTAFEQHRPSYVGTRMCIHDNGALTGETGMPDRVSRWIAPAECIKHKIGSSMSSAWSRDLFEKYGPLRGIEAQDMILPVLALVERGVYYLDEPLHDYIVHADLNNTGIEGQLRAARDETHAKQLHEVNAFHNAHHWLNIWRRLQEAGAMDRLSGDARQELINRVVEVANHWMLSREHLTLERIEPIGMRT